jgi:hypothetical protein
MYYNTVSESKERGVVKIITREILCRMHSDVCVYCEALAELYHGGRAPWRWEVSCGFVAGYLIVFEILCF